MFLKRIDFSFGDHVCIFYPLIFDSFVLMLDWESGCMIFFSLFNSPPSAFDLY